MTRGMFHSVIGLQESGPEFDIAACGNTNVKVVAGTRSVKSFAMNRRVARLPQSRV